MATGTTRSILIGACLLAASTACSEARDKPIPSRKLGPWLVVQEEPGSPDRTLFTAIDAKGGKGPVLTLNCDGAFSVDVVAEGAPIYADEYDATLIFPGGVEKSLPSDLVPRKLLHVVATSLRDEIINAPEIGVRLRNRDGSPRDVFFQLPDLSPGKALLDQFCPRTVLGLPTFLQR